VGSAYGGWWLPFDLVEPSWVCYSAGVGEDSSFDREIAQRGCDVLLIDPTPRALRHVAPLVEAQANVSSEACALWSEDTTVRFYPPANREHVSYSVTNRQGTDEPIEVPARTLSDIAAARGHGTIDLLKLDIEGAEYEVLDTAPLADLGVKVLCVEFHNDYGLKKMIETVRGVCGQGFSVAKVWGTHATFVANDLMPT
jgi:FkbM family methyltransferase